MRYGERGRDGGAGRGTARAVWLGREGGPGSSAHPRRLVPASTLSSSLYGAGLALLISFRLCSLTSGPFRLPPRRQPPRPSSSPSRRPTSRSSSPHPPNSWPKSPSPSPSLHPLGSPTPALSSGPTATWGRGTSRACLGRRSTAVAPAAAAVGRERFGTPVWGLACGRTASVRLCGCVSGQRRMPRAGRRPEGSRRQLGSKRGRAGSSRLSSTCVPYVHPLSRAALGSARRVDTDILPSGRARC